MHVMSEIKHSTSKNPNINDGIVIFSIDVMPAIIVKIVVKLPDMIENDLYSFLIVILHSAAVTGGSNSNEKWCATYIVKHKSRCHGDGRLCENVELTGKKGSNVV